MGNASRVNSTVGRIKEKSLIKMVTYLLLHLLLLYQLSYTSFLVIEDRH
jgi:hypothetical protein